MIAKKHVSPAVVCASYELKMIKGTMINKDATKLEPIHQSLCLGKFICL